MFKSKGNASIWVIVGLLLVAAVLLFVFSDGNGGDSDTATTTVDQTQATGQEVTTIEEVQTAIQAGDSIQCSFSSQDGVSGTAYVRDGQIRVVAVGDAATTNMIFVDGDVYVWREGTTEGVSVSADTFSEFSGGSWLPARPADIAEGVSSGNAACSLSLVENSLFTLPQTVTFASYASSSMQTDDGNPWLPNRQ